jgi:hypothetical protein
MDELGRLGPDDMYAEQQATVAMKDQLEHAGSVAEDLSSSDLAVLRAAPS